MCEPIRHKHADLIIAWANGAQIQYSMNGEYWSDSQPEDWRAPFYRIKPKPLVKKWKWVVEMTNNSLAITAKHYSSENAFEKAYPAFKAIQKIDSTMIEVEE